MDGARVRPDSQKTVITSTYNLTLETYLGKVLADVFGCGTEVVAEGAGIASLTGTLAKELARDVRGICSRLRKTD